MDVSATLTVDVAVVNDGVACTDDSCDAITGVVTNAPNDSLCDDSQFCNGIETCNATLGCQAGTAPSCNDLVVCTDDSCDAAGNAGAGACVNTANDGNCNDSNVCTTDVCDTVHGCVNSTVIYDLDGTGLVDITDFALFAPHFASFAGDPAYSPCADFYFDAVIDAADVSFFATAIGKPCVDVSIVLPDAVHLPPLGCPAGPLGRLSAIEAGGNTVSLEVNAVVLRASSPFTSSDVLPMSLTNPIAVRSVFVAEVWVRMSGNTAAGLTGGSLSLYVDPELAVPLSANVDPGFGLFQGGDIDAFTGSVTDLVGATLYSGVAVGEWVRFASVEFEARRSGVLRLELSQGHMAFAQYSVGAIAPAAMTLTGAPATIEEEVVKPRHRPRRSGR